MAAAAEQFAEAALTERDGAPSGDNFREC